MNSANLDTLPLEATKQAGIFTIEDILNKKGRWMNQETYDYPWHIVSQKPIYPLGMFKEYFRVM